MKYDAKNPHFLSNGFSQSILRAFVGRSEREVEQNPIRQGDYPPKSLDQKYEKVATIESQSPDIENDEKKVRDLINSTGSIVQYENSSGLKQRKNRVIKLAVDVPPEKFDELVNEFKQIGKNVASNDR